MSIETHEGYRVSQAVRVNAYPLLAVIVLRYGHYSRFSSLFFLPLTSLETTLITLDCQVLPIL